jgi:2-polyprenyl-3-methyl-5-hydroxy-6-metoxy-1,4-benzoquinol methylase
MIDVFATVDDLPFEDNEFDTILCTNVLEHVAENVKGFEELSRCLKKGGYIIVSTPYLMPTHEAPYDFYRYTIYGLKHQMERNNLQVVEMIPLGGVGLLMVVYFNYFINKFLKVKLLSRINCVLQRLFYMVYKKNCFKKICNGMGKMNSIISCGYIVIARKNK